MRPILAPMAIPIVVFLEREGREGVGDPVAVEGADVPDDVALADEDVDTDWAVVVVPQ